MPVPHHQTPVAVGYLGWRAPGFYSVGVAAAFNPKYPTVHHRKGSYRLEENDMAPARMASGRGIILTDLSFAENRVHENRKGRRHERKALEFSCFRESGLIKRKLVPEILIRVHPFGAERFLAIVGQALHPAIPGIFASGQILKYIRKE